LSDQTQECVDCHRTVTPGIVEDWLSSEHASSVPFDSMGKPELEREVSSPSIPEDLAAVAVGCFECHGLNPDKHEDNFDHFGYKTNIIVSPADCATCHEEEKEQYTQSKKANALANLNKNPVYHTLVETITSLKTVQGTSIVQGDSQEFTKDETCYACHGTPVKFVGTKTVKTELGELDVPVLSRWPNQGVGRTNPDGSRGACTSCHPRHSFSIAIARKPETCSQCHLEPDVPAWNVYRESKHGNYYQAKGDEWTWDNIPWVLGRDFKAPTCAACHNSLLTDIEGEVVAERSHDFGARLWIRIFGLIYSHPQPKSGQTYNLKNKDELPLPVTFRGEQASAYLLDRDQQEDRLERMMNVCGACHSTSWTGNHFKRFHQTVNEVDKMVWAATELMLEVWANDLEEMANPFNETIETSWVEQWLFYANSVRYAAAMMGPDYAAFKNGWWKLTKNLQDMRDIIRSKR
ncbi:MAG: multiheme c-type cytochrome, partial [Candidatus Aminicenantes bacterium]